MGDARDTSAMRERIRQLLQGGLETAWTERADNDETLRQTLGKLRASDGGLDPAQVRRLDDADPSSALVGQARCPQAMSW